MPQAASFKNDVTTGQCLHSLDEHQQEVWSVAFSPDGQTLATGCDEVKQDYGVLLQESVLKSFRDTKMKYSQLLLV